MRAKLLAIAVCLMAALPQAKAAIVTDVQVNNQSDRVEITATTNGQAQAWCNQSRVGKWAVLDIAAGYGAKTVRLPVAGGTIYSVRAGWYGQKPPRTRIAVSTRVKAPYELTRVNANTLKWTIFKMAAKAVVKSDDRLPVLPLPSALPAVPEASQARGTSVTGVSVFILRDRLEVRAKTDGKVAAWTNRAMNGRAVTLAMMASYKTRRIWQGVQSANIVHVEAGRLQNRPPISRVIVSVLSKVPYDLDTSDSREVVLTVWKSDAAREASLAKKTDLAKVAGLIEEMRRPEQISAVALETPCRDDMVSTSESITIAQRVKPDLTAASSSIAISKVISDAEPCSSPLDTPQGVEPQVKFNKTIDPAATVEMAIAQPATPALVVAQKPASVLAEEPSSSPIELVAVAEAPQPRYDSATNSRERVSLDELALAQPSAPRVSIAAQKSAVKPVRPLSSIQLRTASAKSRVQTAGVKSKVAGTAEELDTTKLKLGDVIPPSADLRAADPKTGKLTDIKVTVQDNAKSSASVNRLDVVAVATTQNKTSDLVSLNFVGTDINDVLKALAMQSGANIITATDVKGEVTVSLQNVDFENALNSIAKLSGYQWAREKNTYFVASSKSLKTLSTDKDSGDLITVTVPFSRLRASDVQSVIGGEFPNVKVTPAGDPAKARKVILQGSEQDVAGATKLLEKIVNAVSPIGSSTTFEIYNVRYASPASLAMLLSTLVPNVGVDPGVVPDDVGTLTKVSGDTSASAGDTSSGSSDTGAAAAAATSANTGSGSSSTASASAGEQSKNTWGVSYTGLMRTLILSGRPEDIAKAKEILAKVDVPSPQVMIEAKVVDVDVSDTKKLGFLYDQSANGFNFGLSSLDHDASTTDNYNIALNASFIAELTGVNANVLAHPKISAMDGKPAQIFIGDKITYVQSIQSTPSGMTVTTGTVEAGIILNCLSKINVDEGTITLNVAPEVSTPTFLTDKQSSVTLPQVHTRRAESVIRLKDGETIIIGGLINSKELDTLT
ncbi:MAG: secretin N-terminal domain-containing protein, partial [Armatimonadota bacterium]